MLAFLQRIQARWPSDPEVRKAVVAVSGGADSIALLWALHRLWSPKGVALVVAHVHHGLRGADADADARFVAASALRLGLPFVLRNVDVPAAMAATGGSVELAARRLRRNALLDTAAEADADAVCTGHTADDQLETLFLRLGRGTGPRGLGGIAPRTRHGSGPLWLRPLLDCRRADLRAWLREEGIPWQEDATNGDSAIPRNRVRLQLVPAFEVVLGPQAAANALRTLALLRDEEEAWLAPLVTQALADASSQEESSGTTLDCKRLRHHPRPLARRLLLAWLQRQGVPAAHQTLERIDALTDLALAPDRGSRQLEIGGGWLVRRHYARLCAARETTDTTPRPPPPATPLAVPGTTWLEAWQLEVAVEPTTGFERPARCSPLELPQSAWLRADAAAQGLALRTVQPGDRMAAAGRSGHRKLADILVDLKVPRAQRPRVPVLACGAAVAWLPGYGVAAPFAVPDAQAPSLRLTLRRRSCNRDGFTLVETLVALALAGLVLVPATLALHRLLRQEQDVERALRSELVARQLLEETALDATRPEHRHDATQTRLTPDGKWRTVTRLRGGAPGEPARASVEISDMSAPGALPRRLERGLPPLLSTESAPP